MKDKTGMFTSFGTGSTVMIDIVYLFMNRLITPATFAAKSFLF